MARKSTSTAPSSRKDDAKISVYDHGLLYGDGVFEGFASTAARFFCFQSTSSGL